MPSNQPHWTYAKEDVVFVVSGDKKNDIHFMANTPDQTQKLSFIIKKYPEGKFSGELDSGGIRAGAEVTVVGPYGTCFRRDERQGPLILVGAGSGMK